jgi:uncharacterized protein YPO0396
MTKERKPVSHKREVARTRAALDKAVTRVYAAAPNDQMRFWDCLALAHPDVAAAYAAARDALDTTEQDAISAGKAYRASFGLLRFYR